VQPHVHERLAGRALALGNLVLVVRKDVVDRPRVDVESLPQVLHAHRRALDVPPRTPLSPRRRPRRLARLRRLPQREVLDVLLLVLVVGDAIPAPGLLEIDPGELSVVRERGDAEVHRALRLVRVAALLQPSDEGDHLGDVVRRPRVVLRGLDSQPADVAEERLRMLRGEVPERETRLLRSADRLVVHVGQVHDLGDPRGPAEEMTPEHVLEDEGPQIADVNDVVDRGAARVEADVARLDRLEVDEPATQRVVKLHQTPRA